MQKLNKQFTFKKIKGNYDSKEVSALYLAFFFSVSMRNKVDDLKRVYVDNKIRGVIFSFPINSSFQAPNHCPFSKMAS